MRRRAAHAAVLQADVLQAAMGALLTKEGGKHWKELRKALLKD